MRFAVAHKTATYLMVGFALVAMVGGGGVGPIFALGGIAAFLVSWFWEPPFIRFEKWTWVWTGLSVFALLYSVLTAIATGDFLGVGAQFLVWLVIVKAYNRRAARDWQQLYLLAFLMLVAGSVLNADLTFGLCFLGFVISTTWALTMFHLRREMEENLLVKHSSQASERVEVKRILESKRIVNGRFFLGTGLLSFGVFIASAAAFLALPRVGIGFFLKTRPGMTLAGFSDGVKLGGHGVLKNDPTVVMRVEIDPKIGGREAPYIHWRGVAFDQYWKGEWSRSKLAPPSFGISGQASRGVDRYYAVWPDQPHLAPDWDDGAEQQLDGHYTRENVWLEPLDSDVLFGASTPMAYQYAHAMRPRTEKHPRNDEFRLDHGTTVHYQVWSDLHPPSVERLRAANGPLPEGFESYLGPNVNPFWDPAITIRTRVLAGEITRGLTNNYDRATAIVTWLQKNTSYTLELAEPGKQEPIDFFLFDRKKGHCEYFASAFAILARSVGIPVRQVNGFLGGEWNEYKGYVAVRAGDAHSWDEVYFPGTGWVTFDPTPPASIDELGRGGTGWTAKLSRMMDTLRFQWSKWVIEYDLGTQMSLFKGIGRGIKSAAVAVKTAGVWVKNRAVDHLAITITVTLGIAAIALRRRRRLGAAMVERGRVIRTRTTIATLFDRAHKQLAKAGHARATAETPREFAARLVGIDAPGATALAELVELYYAAEWGRARDAIAEPRAIALGDAIRAALAARKRAA